ncbi:MAG: glycosyl transferase family protein [Ignavibacteria bacterium]|nr:MAG: glycosyl transferase family protein [Ignavibacteria bacterium]KAF0158545.1 MAG: glycosyl transferase family protein [Ignavibacteria bacterium]
MNKIKLCICIPTYNRSKFLEVCLEYLVPQVKHKENVEVIVIDNASTDNTMNIMNAIISAHSNIHYYRNEMNIGYSGNQVKCIEYSNGQYTAILSDDDVYTDNLVDDILNITNEREYSFIALNYYSFMENVTKPLQANFAPTSDINFSRGYDIMNYPSVGHFSGFVFNSRLAKETLREMLQKHSFEEYEKYRGVISDIAHRSLSKTDIPAFFFGRRKLATRIPKEVDYDLLNHQCLDYYDFFENLYNEAYINIDDLKYRKKLVLKRLVRSVISDCNKKNKNEMILIQKKLKKVFNDEIYFFVVVNMFFYLGRTKYFLKIVEILNNIRKQIIQFGI